MSPENCPWCGFNYNAVGFCSRGCAVNAIYSGRCIDCGKEFVTGRFSADQCLLCEKKENARHVRESDGDDVSHTGYGARQRRDAINRNAMAKLDPAAVERERQKIREAIRLDLHAGEK